MEKYEKQKIIAFKHALKICSQEREWTSWKVINERTKQLLTTLLTQEMESLKASYLADELITEVNLRLDTIRTIRKDNEWVLENGFPISKNSVGIKLSRNALEIKEYIRLETSRFVKGLYNLREAKEYANELFNKEYFNIDFADISLDALEKEGEK